ncbi:DNA-binding transcriptional regulator, MarR family [Tistlia consotensis]|uniref:DNA-binding transcriptional regulator, MarR family n=1 Tax=Tistlia consotensis USBA 355 TaxID=560819 RepID=A0A1Y6CIC4_9PROT|nr:MarR family winged helix-turn-helix transcriptional regulator [Tistlia consotensis]SMF67599.1 DNA-binding transcriptional regulator, MarR family [Tistlia consotensis USBA 355]SNR99855.1 DNA-binding transcriptional regulator, MarR family [Tistlia consotensis]
MPIPRQADAGRPADGRAPCPGGRLSSPSRTIDGRPVLDLSSYIPYFLASVNNALSRGASQTYLATFGVGIVEWRVVSMLAIEPGIAAARICEIIALDKAATSRALSRLSELGYLAFETPGSDPRRKAWWLNARGYELHDRILALALERERRLIEGIDPEDLEAFLRVMRRMRRNVDRIAGGEDGSKTPVSSP